MKRKISIVTISYNAENEIEETIKSVLQQHYRPLEYLLIDGASKDRTPVIIKNSIKKMQHVGIEVKYVSEPDNGISDAFNKGIHLSTGDIVGLINAGDGLCADALEKVGKAFEELDADIIYGNTVCIDKKNKISYLRQIPKGIDVKRIKYDGLIFTHQSAFVRKEVYEKYGLYDTSFKHVMDSDLFAKFAENDVKFCYINETLVSMLAGGISSKPTLKLVRENIRVAKRYGGYSAFKIYVRWIIGLPRSYVVAIIKKCPFLWYLLIGKERMMNANKKK